MSVSLGIAMQANTNAAIASDTAHRAECRVILSQYDPRDATVESMQEYADCINLVHPQHLNNGEVIAVKIMIVAALIGVMWGCIYGYRDSCYDRLQSTIAYGFCGLLILPTVTACLLGLLYGIYFLFT